MSSFQHTNPLWDFSLPPESLTSLPDDDFLAIIQSQMTNPSLVSDQSAFFIPHQISNDVPLSANPKSLTRIPNPPVVPTPSDSSPSPPSAQETTTSSRRDNPRRRSLGDDALKRKAYREQEEDDDDDDEQPSHRANPAERGKAYASSLLPQLTDIA
jgi:AP-1-like transcription factor